MEIGTRVFVAESTFRAIGHLGIRAKEKRTITRVPGDQAEMSWNWFWIKRKELELLSSTNILIKLLD